MKFIARFLFSFVCVMLIAPTPVYAYLDPGTATVLLQVLAGVALFLGIFWRLIIRFFKKIFRKLTGKTSTPADKSDVINRIED